MGELTPPPLGAYVIIGRPQLGHKKKKKGGSELGDRGS